MMNRSTISKLSIACAVCCAVICGIAIAPAIMAIILALFALLCLVGCVLILFAGMFVWLFTIGQTNIFGYATSIADFALGMFNFIAPVAKFSFTYITPIGGWIAVGIGVLGIILSSVGISKAKNQPAKIEVQDNLIDAPATRVTADGTFDTPIYVPRQETPTEDTGKKKKTKKKKTDKGVCVASLTVSIVFTVIALISILVAAFALSAF